MKRFLSVFLCLILSFTCLCSLGITASADDGLPVPITYDGTVTNSSVIVVETQEEFKAVYNALNLYKQAEEFKAYNGHVTILLSPSENLVIDNAEPTVYDLSGTSLYMNTGKSQYTFTIGENASLVAASFLSQSGFSSDIIVKGKLSVTKCELYRNLTITQTGTFEVTGKENSSFLFSYFSNAGIMNIRNSNVLSVRGETCINDGKIFTPDKKLIDTDSQKDIPLTGSGNFEKLITNELTPDENGNAEGNTPLSIKCSTISQPSYTVVIPTKVDFKSLSRTKDSSIKTQPMTLSATGISNLFANDKKLVVTVTSKNEFNLSDGSDSSNLLEYKFYTAYTDVNQNTLLSGKTVLEMIGTADMDTNLSKTVNGVVAIDTQNIKKAGTYTDILTFTVALSEVND